MFCKVPQRKTLFRRCTPAPRSIQHLWDQKNPQLMAFYPGTKYLQTYLRRFAQIQSGRFFQHVRRTFYLFLIFVFDIRRLWICTQQSLDKFASNFSLFNHWHCSTFGHFFGSLQTRWMFLIVWWTEDVGWLTIVFPVGRPTQCPLFSLTRTLGQRSRGPGQVYKRAGSHCLWPVSSLWLPFSAPSPDPVLALQWPHYKLPSVILCLPSLACHQHCPLSLVAQAAFTFWCYQARPTLTKHISALSRAHIHRVGKTQRRSGFS